MSWDMKIPSGVLKDDEHPPINMCMKPEAAGCPVWPTRSI